MTWYSISHLRAAWRDSRAFKALSICSVAAILLSILIVRLSSDFVGFIPFDRRYFYSPVDGLSTPLYVLAFALPLIPAFVRQPQVGRRLSWTVWSGAVVAVMAVAALSFTSVDMTRRETENRYAFLAEHQQWKDLLQLTQKADYANNKLAMDYALLAESQLGTLPAHLFTYPIRSAEDFFYLENAKAECCQFDRLFYDCLGLYDACYAQAVQFGMTTQEGTCFASLRQMARYALLEGDSAVAARMFDVLALSSCHSKTVKAGRQAITRVANRTAEKPLLDSLFIETYPLEMEMMMLHERYPDNQKILDYYLCSLLLGRHIGRFALELSRSEYYRTHPLPLNYAQACIMVAGSPAEAYVRELSLPDQLYQAFGAFSSILEQDHSLERLTDYKGTYWYYFFDNPNTVQPTISPAVQDAG